MASTPDASIQLKRWWLGSIASADAFLRAAAAGASCQDSILRAVSLVLGCAPVIAMK